MWPKCWLEKETTGMTFDNGLQERVAFRWPIRFEGSKLKLRSAEFQRTSFRHPLYPPSFSAFPQRLASHCLRLPVPVVLSAPNAFPLNRIRVRLRPLISAV